MFIKIRIIHTAITVVYVCFPSLFGCNQNKVTLHSLLKEMSNREVLSIIPEEEYLHKQFSSYNRKSISPQDSGWFANQDMSHFIRVEQNEGRREFVMLDANGPGVIVRWWMTFYKAQDGIIRVYLDKNPNPVLEGRPDSLLSGHLLAGYPFTSSVQEGASLGGTGRDYDHNLYFPIPFSRHCKVTYECDSLKRLYDYEGIDVPSGYWWPDVFYNIGCRFYSKKTIVESFNIQEFEKQRLLMEKTGCDLLENRLCSVENRSFGKHLQPDDSLSVEINRSRSSIDYLSVVVDPSHNSQALRSTVLKISFDDIQTVWVPIGDFFGSGCSFSPHKSWMNQSDDKGKLESFWVMPFRDKCTITLINYGNEPVEISGSIGMKRYRWKSGSMYFGASWHEYHQVRTRDENNSPYDLNFIEIAGKGIYVGDLIALFNSTWLWWGEGDEKFFIDGESFPSSFGTGTEDYYGYSFGRVEAFSHPFIAQPIGEGNMNQGLTVNMRQRSLDAIPFNSSLSANIELWHWADVYVNYALTSFYYVKPPFTINIKPDIEMVRFPIPENGKI